VFNENSNYDIYGLSSNADGSIVNLLLVSYNNDYTTACWRLYQTTMDDIMSNGPKTAISNAAGLVDVDHGFNDPSGYYWEVAYYNGDGGMLVFVKGAPIRISKGNDYNVVLKLIKDTLYGGIKVDFMDLIGEMIYQEAQGILMNVHLGKTRNLVKAVKAAAARIATARAATAEAEEEEEK
jgi:hypothetical protein